jgi:alpha-tubulin suppressor-like RCC1 family protein
MDASGNWRSKKGSNSIPFFLGGLLFSLGAWFNGCAAGEVTGAFAWGSNDVGQIGNGTLVTQYSPVALNTLGNVLTVASGPYHNLAVKTDGTVWAWGSNASGQLGDGTTINRSAPVQVLGLTNVRDVAAGDGHSLALKADGTVWAWGLNNGGQLGTGTTINSSTPIRVSGLAGAASVAAGNMHSLALMSDGSVNSWGWNSNGQLGNGTTTNRFSPGKVLGLTNVKTLAKYGFNHHLALTADGSVWGWGNNDYATLGELLFDTILATGGNNYRSLPTKISGLTGVSAISTNLETGLAVKSDGTVWAWGINLADFGLLTTLTNTHAPFKPFQIQGMTGIKAVACGRFHNLFLRLDGTVWGLGDCSHGEFGTGETGRVAAGQTVPGAQALGLAGMTGISAGYLHSVAWVSTPLNIAPIIVSAPWANPNPITLPAATMVNVVASDSDNGPSALTYTWSKIDGPGTVTITPNGTALSNSAAASFSVAGSYTLRVTVSDGAANVTGDVSVTVNTAPIPPVITTQPVNKTVTVGQTATFSVIASGTPLSYQWRKGGVSISGATGATYTTPTTISADNGTLFSVVISNSAGSVASSNATLTVNPTDTSGPLLDVPSVILKGTANDPSGVATLTVNGTAVTVNADGTWQKEVPLTSATTTIMLKATDRVGNATSKAITIAK